MSARSGNCFKRLSASLHVKDLPAVVTDALLRFQTPFGITACERRTRPKYSPQRSCLFQTPFGITACESRYVRTVVHNHACFKRLSASLHVKGRGFARRILKTSCFKRLSASLHVKGRHRAVTRLRVVDVSNAFRHHCM